MSSNRRKQGRAWDDNGAGVVSYRGWLYSGDRDGNALHPEPSERYEKTSITDARLAAGPLLSTALPAFEDMPERPDIREEMARLSTAERMAWSLSRSGFEFELTRVEGVPVGELEAMRRRGFTPIEGTKRFDVIAGHDVEVWDVEGEEAKQQGLTYAQIAERMGATLRQVKRWLAEARRKLRGER